MLTLTQTLKGLVRDAFATDIHNLCWARRLQRAPLKQCRLRA